MGILMDVYENSVRSGISKAGNPYIMQAVYLNFPNEPVASKVTVFVDEPIEPGQYDLDLSASIYVQNEQLRVGRLVYTKASPKPAVAAAK